MSKWVVGYTDKEGMAIKLLILNFLAVLKKELCKANFRGNWGNLENLVKFCEFLNICFLMLLHVFLPHAYNSV